MEIYDLGGVKIIEREDSVGSYDRETCYVKKKNTYNIVFLFLDSIRKTYSEYDTLPIPLAAPN